MTYTSYEVEYYEQEDRDIRKWEDLIEGEVRNVYIFHDRPILYSIENVKGHVFLVWYDGKNELFIHVSEENLLKLEDKEITIKECVINSLYDSVVKKDIQCKWIKISEIIETLPEGTI